MEATIKTDDPKTFNAVVQFLKSLDIKVFTKKVVKKSTATKYPLRGSVLKYESPYEPATDLQTWDIYK